MPDPKKRELSDAAVVRLQGILDPTDQVVHVHWDDCDSDEARFWFHIRMPKVRWSNPEDGRVKDLALRIREAWKLVRKELEVPSPYQFEIHRESQPIGRYGKAARGRGWFKEYEGDTWVYKLTIFG